ncbi:MAG: hypothetical protein VX733_15560 [Candidatus Latescibacterota bacterium]|nr:hypothetical protein [Candidatus Latescibacterota bacterium]
MKIAKFFSRRRTRLVKITTDNGLVGWEETTSEGKPQNTCVAVDEMVDYIVGKDPLRIDHHWQHSCRSAFARGGSVVLSALSGIDRALWDVVGGKPNPGVGSSRNETSRGVGRPPPAPAVPLYADLLVLPATVCFLAVYR